MNRLFLAIISLSMLSCYQPATPEKLYTESAPIEPTYDTSITVTIPQEDEMSDFTVKPIAEYERYIVRANGSVYGIDSKESEPLKAVKAVSIESGECGSLKFHDFFRVDGITYYSVQTFETENGEDVTDENPAVEIIHYYSQRGGTVTEIEAADYPAKPDPAYTTMDDTPFKIVTGEWNGEPKSDVYCGTRVRAYVMLDSVYRVPAGLWYGVTGSFYSGTGNVIAAGAEGVWFCSEEDKRVNVCSDGRMW